MKNNYYFTSKKKFHKIFFYRDKILIIAICLTLNIEYFEKD